MATTKNTRDYRVSFRTGVEVRQKLDDYAEKYGISVSAMVALIVGQWLYQQEEMVKPMLANIEQQVVQIAREMLMENKKNG